MGDVATFLFFFLTYVATAAWFHWRGFNIGLDVSRTLKREAPPLSVVIPTIMVATIFWLVFEYF